MSDIIHLLPDHVANQIAAGEVVQRPSSVVKELLENAIDAKASTIKLIIQDAGKALIQVIDNGLGMSVTDARLSFERHATSKIKTAEDLFRLKTKGFRGEALASIAAIAQVDLKTKQFDDEIGTFIKIKGSKVEMQDVIATSIGTNISVKNLFYNIPARRNFLKSNQIETRHIIDEFQRVALAHPSISFSFYHNSNQIYQLEKSNLRQRIVSIFGKKTNEKLVPIEEQTDIISISGYVAKPEFAKKKRGEQFLFVNDRFIKSNYLNHAVSSAFEGLLGYSYYPSFFLYLKVPTQHIDINIHPTKTEVKFEDEKTIYAILRSTIKHSLGQYNVAPILDFERDASLDLPYETRNKSFISTPKINVDSTFNPFKSASENNYNAQNNKRSSDWQALYNGLENTHQLIGSNVDSLNNLELFESSNSLSTSNTIQLHQKYIISTIKSGLVLIDQNLAHQRVLYEEFLEKFTEEDSLSQKLLFPISINFSPAEILLIKELQNDLENIGFGFDKFENDNIIINGMPTGIKENNITPIFEQLLEDVQNNLPSNSFSQLDTLSKTMAKSLAVKAGLTLNTKEQEELVNKLFECKEPSNSPFGKKIFTTLSLEELTEKLN